MLVRVSRNAYVVRRTPVIHTGALNFLARACARCSDQSPVFKRKVVRIRGLAPPVVSVDVSHKVGSKDRLPQRRMPPTKDVISAAKEKETEQVWRTYFKDPTSGASASSARAGSQASTKASGSPGGRASLPVSMSPDELSGEDVSMYPSYSYYEYSTSCSSC